MKVNFYFFGDIGPYDRYNPAYVLNKEYVDEIIYLIGYNNPFSIDKKEIMKTLNMEEDIFDERINSLKLIEAIEVKEDKYRITFPLFLEKDVRDMEEYLLNIGEKIGEKIITIKSFIYDRMSTLNSLKHFSKERLLYHIICDSIFDGHAFDFFDEQQVIAVSKMQPDNRDYIIVAYEDSKLIESHSNKLLCSSNNYRTEKFVFNSFGDSNGNRKDMYRFFRMLQSSTDKLTPFKDLNIEYIRMLDAFNRNLIEKLGELMIRVINGEKKYDLFSIDEKNLLGFLKEAEYIDVDEDNHLVSVKVPVFYSEDKEVVKGIADIVLEAIYPIVKEFFENFNVNAKNLTAIRHNVGIEEIGNELWHQIFGATNEYLVKTGFVEMVKHIDRQGRYLRSFKIK